MALKNSQYDTIMRQYSRMQLENRRKLDAHIQKAYSEIPELEDLDRKAAEISLKKARILLAKDTSTDDFDLSEQLTKLSARRAELLRTHGLPEDYLKLPSHCRLCQDTGYVNGKKCSCFKRMEIDLLYTQSNIRELLKTENFSNFSFDFYSTDIINPLTGKNARETAHDAVKKAQMFITQFDTSFDNLFLYGETGVGKTFLTHCIARELLEQAYCVIYFTSFDLFDLLAKNAFSASGEPEELAGHVLDCDLLIIDDLGTELTNSFVSSQLFLCVNERILRKKSTIISTNLTTEQFMERYSERTFSRISSAYTMIKLIGRDIRIQKKLMGGKNL